MKRWVTLGLLLLIMILTPGSVSARSHRFLDLQIEAQLRPDGSVHVTETHIVQFEGTFTGMFQWLDTRGGVRVRDITVSEPDLPYERLETTDPGPAGSFFVQEKADEVYVDWSFEATDQIRRFQLSYVLEQVVLRHEDVAELYYKFVGDQWDQPRDQVRIALSLPPGAAQEDIRAWGHGPLDGKVTIVSPRRIVWELNKLPARTFVEARVVFPTDLVPGADRLTHKTALPTILDEETGRIERAERRQKRKEMDPYLAVGAFALASWLAAWIWSRFGKPHPGYKEKYYKELPADYPPAELAILYRGAADSRDFTATLLDLARRGFLTIEELAGKRSYQFTRRETSPEDWALLRSYERELLHFLFEQIDSEQVSLADLQKYAKKDHKGFAEFWKTWLKQVSEAGKRRGFFDEKSRKQTPWFIIPAALFIVPAILAFSSELFICGAVCMVMLVVLLVVIGIASGRRSEEGQQHYSKWRAFRRYLLQFSRVELARVGSLGIWEQVLPYAITLGVADRLLKQLELRFPGLEQEGYHFGAHWFLSSRSAGLTRIGQMTKTVNQSISSVAGSSGGGGGFSGGGGGGVGGGGGGVR